MNHAFFMRRGERIGQGDSQLDHTCDRQAVRSEVPVETLALDQLHREEAGPALLFHGVEDDDVGMIQAGDRARLALEARQAIGIRGHLGRQHLERDLAPELGVASPVHLPHPARAERGDDLVGTETGGGSERHRGNVPQTALKHWPAGRRGWLPFCSAQGSCTPGAGPIALEQRADTDRSPEPGSRRGIRLQ